MPYVLLMTCTLAASPEESLVYLQAKGLKKVGDHYVLPAESALAAKLSAAPRLLAKLRSVAKRKESAETERRSLEDRIAALTKQHSELSQQLPGLERTSPTRYRQAAAAMNQIAAQLIELDNRRRDVSGVKEVLQEYQTTRQEYVEFVLGVSESIALAAANYDELKDDAAVAGALAVLGGVEGKNFQLGPTTGHLSNVRRWDQYKNTVANEDVELRRAGANWLIQVSLNGKIPREMYLDPKTTVVTLPAALAEAVGIVVGPGDPRIELKDSEGKVFDARLTKLSTVQVGGIRIENVECFVLPTEVAGARAVLGQGFLKHFAYLLHEEASRLTLVHVDPDANSTGRPSR